MEAIVHDEISESALAGGVKLMAYFIDAAHEYGRYFLAGPVWNRLDRLVPGTTQYMVYSFDKTTKDKVAFLTTDLEKYGDEDAMVASELEKKILSLVA